METSSKIKLGLGISILFLVLILGFVIQNRSAVGTYVWSNYRSDSLALFIAGQDPALKAQIAEFYFNGGAYDLRKAEKYYNALVAEGVATHDVLFQLGRIAFIQGDFNKALDLLNLQLETYPDKQRAHYIKGLVYMYTQEYPKAQESFKKFVEAHPDEWAGYNDLAWAYFKEGEYEKMKEIALLGLERAPHNLWLNNMAGVALWNLGELGRAEGYLARAETLVSSMTPQEWGGAYPGNDPATYATSLALMRTNVAENLVALRLELAEVN